MSNALMITCHPRQDSLTMKVAELFCENAKGVTFENADLYREGFDPRLPADDEPDWDNPRKVYSLETQNEMARVERNQATVMVFPVWWWSMPAMLKGWIDRVLNHGWAYGDQTYPHKDVWMLAIAGNDAAAYKKREYDKAVAIQMQTGILDYCGVERSRLEMLWGAIEGDDQVVRLLERTAALGQEFAATIV